MAADRVVGKQFAAPRVLVYLTEGGILEHVADGELDMEVVDFQNLAKGDVAPEMTSEMIEMLRREAPDLLIDLDKYRARFECQDCGKEFWDEKALLEIKNLLQRVSPGEIMPAGECPKCGALVSVVDRKSWSDDSRSLLRNAERISSVCMKDVIGDYELPESVPEWLWVADHASFRHQGNGKQNGVWEHMLNLSVDYQNIPETLKPLISEAKRDGIAYLLFHQGT